MTLKKLTMTATLLAASQVTSAAGLINDMQTCQGLLVFMDNRLESAQPDYDADDVAVIRQGLDGYNQYIQREIVTPGLVKFNRGDTAKADAMQEQVDAYKANLVKGYEKRYPQNQLFADHVVALNECTKKSVPKGEELEGLKKAFTTLQKVLKML